MCELGAKRVFGVDVSEGSIQIAKVLAKEKGIESRTEFVLIKEYDPLDFIPDQSYNIVIASEAMEHIYPKMRKKVLKTLWKKLAVGGILLISAPNRILPIEYHTTGGVPFLYWLPTEISCAIARKASWRCKGKTNDVLIRDGLRGYSWFEAWRFLKLLGAEDLAQLIGDKSLPYPAGIRGIYNKFVRLLCNLGLNKIAPPEAFYYHLYLAFRKKSSAYT